MGERFSDDNDTSSSESGKDNKETRWVKPPLVPSSLELHREVEALPPPTPPPGFLEKFLDKEESETEKEEGDEEEADAGTAAETTSEEGVAEGRAEESEPADAFETEARQTPEAAVD